jgi:hypothetical protein
LGQRTDNHGDNAQAALWLSKLGRVHPVLGSRLYSLSGPADSGIIESVYDVDYFRFRVVDGGTVYVNLHPGLGVNVEHPSAGPGPNLQARLQIWNSTGTRIIAEGRHYLQLLALIPNQLQLPGEPSALMTGQEYLISVRSSGDYGDLGYYTVTVDGPVADESGPRVINAKIGCPVGGIESVRVTFDQPIDFSSTYHTYFLGRSGIQWQASLTGPSGPIEITSIQSTHSNDPTPTVFDVLFPAQSQVGSYQLELGPDIRAFGGYPMNQDSMLPNGQPGHDHFTFHFRIGLLRPSLAQCIDEPLRAQIQRVEWIGSKGLMDRIALTVEKEADPEGRRKWRYSVISPGEDRIFGTKDDRLHRIRTVEFNEESSLVTLTLDAGLDVNEVAQLLVMETAEDIYTYAKPVQTAD